MSRKLMLLATGALTALTLAVLPAVASAGEFWADCSSGAGCFGTVSGGAIELEEDSGLRIGCTSYHGNLSQTNNSSTGSVALTFTGCASSGFSCGNSGTGVIVTGFMVSHFVYLGIATKLPAGVLLTGVNVTFSCAGGLVKKTVTGNVIGEITNPSCGTAKTSHAITFAAGFSTGSQKYLQITGSGTVFDLTSGSHGSDITTTSLTGSGTVTYGAFETLKLTC